MLDVTLHALSPTYSFIELDLVMLAALTLTCI